jgi:hypothetical protein
MTLDTAFRLAALAFLVAVVAAMFTESRPVALVSIALLLVLVLRLIFIRLRDRSIWLRARFEDFHRFLNPDE